MPFSCHTCPLPLLWHEFDNCLCSIRLKFQVVMYLLWRHRSPPDKLENDQVTLIDLCTVLIYDCWRCFLVFNIWVSPILEMTINLPNLPLSFFVVFFIYPTFCSLNILILVTQPFSLRSPPPPPPPPPLATAPS
jgi:hypothetical protein